MFSEMLKLVSKMRSITKDAVEASFVVSKRNKFANFVATIGRSRRLNRSFSKVSQSKSIPCTTLLKHISSTEKHTDHVSSIYFLECQQRRASSFLWKSMLWNSGIDNGMEAWNSSKKCTLLNTSQNNVYDFHFS